MAEQNILDLPTPKRTLFGRFGLRTEILAIVILGALAGGFFGNQYLSAVYSPESTVKAYLAAEDRNDADAVWAAISIDPSAGSKATASLLTKGALAAWLHANHAPHSAVQEQAVTTNGDRSTVDLSYSQGGTVQNTSIVLVRDLEHGHYGLYPTWRVVVTPALVNLAVATGSGSLTIDGLEVPIAQGSTESVALFPGLHKVAVAASRLLAAQAAGLDTGRAPNPLTLQPPPSDSGKAAAADVVKTAVQLCAKSTEDAPKDCPQSYAPNGLSPVSWQLIGDPSQGLTYSYDPDGVLQAEGIYQMIATIGGVGSVQAHRAVAGPFSAKLVAGTESFKISTILGVAGAPAATRPATVTDDAVRAALKPLLAACAALTVPNTPDCPQQGYSIIGSSRNLHWSLGDPLSAASVGWDGTKSLFEVTGPANFEVTYVGDLGVSKDNIEQGQTNGYVFWDGTALVPVTLMGGI